MRRTILVLALTGAVVLSSVPRAWPAADYPLCYEYYLQQGMAAFEEGDYSEAIRSFKHAQLVNPRSELPLYYINLIKRIEDGRIDIIDGWEPRLKRPPAFLIPKDRQHLSGFREQTPLSAGHERSRIFQEEKVQKAPDFGEPREYEIISSEDRMPTMSR